MEHFDTITIIITVIGTGYYIHRDMQQDMKSQTARTDRLYEMFLDLLKEKR